MSKRAHELITHTPIDWEIHEFYLQNLSQSQQHSNEPTVKVVVNPEKTMIGIKVYTPIEVTDLLRLVASVETIRDMCFKRQNHVVVNLTAALRKDGTLCIATKGKRQNRTSYMFVYPNQLIVSLPNQLWSTNVLLQVLARYRIDFRQTPTELIKDINISHYSVFMP